jgi:hypothetical protein
MYRLFFAIGIVALVLFQAAPVAAVAQDLTADDYVEFWKPLVGAWKISTETNGNALSHSLDCVTDSSGSIVIGMKANCIIGSGWVGIDQNWLSGRA